MISPGEDYALLDRDAVMLVPTGWALLEMLGSDTLEWLQGQVTNDLRLLKEGGTLPACLCTPTGQMLAVLLLIRAGGRFFITCERGEVQALKLRVEEMVILEDVTVNDLSESYRLVSVQGPQAAANLPFTPRSEAEVTPENVLIVRNDRTGRGGLDVWFPHESEEFMPHLSILGTGAAEVARVEAGIPKSGADYGPKTLPPELGPKFENSHISYEKGCYTGQEVLMRIHSRGHTNRRWVGISSSTAMTANSTVASAEGSAVGVVTSTAESPALGYIARAMIRNEALSPEQRLLVNGAAIDLIQ